MEESSFYHHSNQIIVACMYSEGLSANFLRFATSVFPRTSSLTQALLLSCSILVVKQSTEPKSVAERILEELEQQT